MTSNQLVILKQQLILSKEGFADIVYEEGTLLKVKMISNDHIVVADDTERTFLLKNQDKEQIWAFL
ncbi:hypothetical protein F4V57_04105 [Acinetobacter qingfengensis]|uniref:Uncharacterized protein n=1 Tax=Acinetobacter qingfengensis TaxID=1262585 RepID=A0A1E7RCG0_9GAMM|nr:hypothetical protein [Acinetobacter qingfengensis]KAA8734951.1 hypothetical protein F4V57_04105 [Acinetobacter qingfengensis]OEY97038.1 hypothetical protein BJI46_10915 [Acinetobacter qingfengensis]